MCLHPGNRAVVVLSFERKETKEQRPTFSKSVSGSNLNLFLASAVTQDAVTQSRCDRTAAPRVTRTFSCPCLRCGSATEERDGANRQERTNSRLSTTCCRGASHPQECQRCPRTNCRTPPTQPPPFPKVSTPSPALLLSSCPNSSHWHLLF